MELRGFERLWIVHWRPGCTRSWPCHSPVRGRTLHCLTRFQRTRHCVFPLVSHSPLPCKTSSSSTAVRASVFSLPARRATGFRLPSRRKHAGLSTVSSEQRTHIMQCSRFMLGLQKSGWSACTSRTKVCGRPASEGSSLQRSPAGPRLARTVHLGVLAVRQHKRSPQRKLLVACFLDRLQPANGGSGTSFRPGPPQQNCRPRQASASRCACEAPREVGWVLEEGWEAEVCRGRRCGHFFHLAAAAGAACALCISAPML
jgi:hypothetical protein